MTHWALTRASTFASWLGITFGVSIGEHLDRKGDFCDNAVKAAKTYGTSLRHFESLLYDSTNLKLTTISRILFATNLLAALVVYEYPGRPILPEIFLECWTRLGKPTTMFDFVDLPEDIKDGYETAITALEDIANRPIRGGSLWSAKRAERALTTLKRSLHNRKG